MRLRLNAKRWSAVFATVVAIVSELVPCDGVRAALPVAERTVLERYVDALVHRRYDAAFALLTPDERRYFATPENFASVFGADGLTIDRFQIIESKSASLGTVAVVSEQVAFFDRRRDASAHATFKVAYGIVREPGGYRIKDPNHPWRALAPAGAQATVNGTTVAVRKLSFFTGRLEMVATFANTGSATVTLLPYGRTALRDERGRTYPLIASRLPGLTDKTLYTGLRLAPQARYTGLMTFLTPNRFTPKKLTLTIAPALADGADAPFEIPLPPITLAP
jgi:hypothetical protein